METTQQPNDLPELDTGKVHELQNTAALMQQNTQEHALVNQLLGQAQMADAFGKFSNTVFTSKLAYVKENKLYKALSGQVNADNLQLSGTWQEFCALLGMSDEKANQDIANLKAFGEEALESMSRMGIGYREMRQFRRLPDDEKSALIEVAQSGDKEAFVEIAEEFISKHHKEKEQLTLQLDESQADYEAIQQITQQKDQKLNELAQELEKTRKRVQTMPADEITSELRQIATASAYEAEVAVMGKLRNTVAALIEHSELTASLADSHTQRVFLADLVRQVEVQLIAIREDYDLPDQPLFTEPSWMQPGAADAAADSLGITEEQLTLVGAE
ncbi:hypothetical protein [Nitrincola iocasae]|uniref:hypothetical protein n=1 Tax=Nitrincola iocasae TaxID=2614693 RepID=UPI0017828D7F|nr:hypothetical protein [Nitrincola iocasae]